MLIGMKNGMEFVENPCCDTDLGAPNLGVSIIMGAFLSTGPMIQIKTNKADACKKCDTGMIA